MTILDAMASPTLFGSSFAGPERDAWRAFLGALFGLPMEDDQAALYRCCTGRQDVPTGQANEAWVIVGRRGGKSRIAALIAVYLACFKDYRAVLAPGEIGTLAVIAADRRQARVVMTYITGLIDAVPLLARLVEHRTAESITLATRCRIEVHTASFRAVRGYTIVAAVLDEVACRTHEASDRAYDAAWESPE